MSISPPKIEIEIDSQVEMGEALRPVQEQRARNLYAALLSSAIHDLERLQVIHKIPAHAHESIRKSARLALGWIHGNHKSPASCQQCLDALDIPKEHFMASLRERGLLQSD